MALNRTTINRSLGSKLVDARVAHVFNSFNRVLVTSSFGVTSAVLLHIVSRVRPCHPVHFINTGYHFKETIEYKRRLTHLLGLNVVDLMPDASEHAITKKKMLWESDPGRCCQINKVQPVNGIKSGFDIWMSGLLGAQDNNREKLQIITDETGILRCYPLIDWNRNLMDEYMEVYGLPRHPLEKEGFGSVGCTHCTMPGRKREGRWAGTGKTECGLHRFQNGSGSAADLH